MRYNLFSALILIIIGCNANTPQEVENKVRQSNQLEGALTNSEARQVILDNGYNNANAYCILSNVYDYKPATGGFEFSLYGKSLNCLNELRAAQLGRSGDCIERYSWGECNRIMLMPAGQSKVDSRNGFNTFYFPCGKVKLINIKSISTKENKASVEFERDFQPDMDRLKSIESCNLRVPKIGTDKLRWIMQRNDNGDWELLHGSGQLK